MEGLLRSYPRKGTFVSDVVGDNILQMVHLRSVIEGTAAFWGTKNISDEDIQKMEQYNNTFDYLLHNENLSDQAILDRIGKVNYHFHLILSNAANNEYLTRLILNLGSINNTIRFMYYAPGAKTLDEYENSLSDHTAILRAVQARDPEQAEALTIKHINRIVNTIVEH